MSPHGYQNPVYRHSCPDPFVFKHAGIYWCFSTGVQSDGRCFKILRSQDLVSWTLVGSAMDPLRHRHRHYWAPEVTYDNGVFYMYYSAGDEETMQIRVAVADQPYGPFQDTGHRLTSEPFAIDPHVFVDDDGARYLFYATDFLHYKRIGTGTVVDRLLDPFTPAGKPQPVTRARYDWQVYDPARASKGGVRWHTVEGSFVLKHAGRYYQMYSGGNWQNRTYGVGYAVTDDLSRPGEWEQDPEGNGGLPVLRSKPEAGVIGPGHNSVVRGPDNCELYCVYHRWQPETEERVLAIDRMGWEGQRLRVYGPTTTPQPGPAQPLVIGFQGFTATAGKRSADSEGVRLEPGDGGRGDVALMLPEEEVAVVEITFAAENYALNGSLGLSLDRDGRVCLACDLLPGEKRLAVSAAGQVTLELGEAFNPLAEHLLRLEVDGSRARLFIDHPSVARWEGEIAARPRSLRLAVREATARWQGLAATGGQRARALALAQT